MIAPLTLRENDYNSELSSNKYDVFFQTHSGIQI